MANWKFEGKKKNGRKGAVNMISGPKTEKEARELAAITHPDFKIESATQVDSRGKTIDGAETTAPAEAAPAKTTKTK